MTKRIGIAGVALVGVLLAGCSTPSSSPSPGVKEAPPAVTPSPPAPAPKPDQAAVTPTNQEAPKPKSEKEVPDLGVEIYPSATVDGSSSSSQDSTGSVVSVHYKTKDEAQKVLDFYHEKLGSDSHLTPSLDGTGGVVLKKEGKSAITVTVSRDVNDPETVFTISKISK